MNYVQQRRDWFPYANSLELNVTGRNVREERPITRRRRRRWRWRHFRWVVRKRTQFRYRRRRKLSFKLNYAKIARLWVNNSSGRPPAASIDRKSQSIPAAGISSSIRSSRPASIQGENPQRHRSLSPVQFNDKSTKHLLPCFHLSVCYFLLFPPAAAAPAAPAAASSRPASGKRAPALQSKPSAAPCSHLEERDIDLFDFCVDTSRRRHVSSFWGQVKMPLPWRRDTAPA